MRLCRLSQRRVGVLGIGRLIVFLFRQRMIMHVKYRGNMLDSIIWNLCAVWPSLTTVGNKTYSLRCQRCDTGRKGGRKLLAHFSYPFQTQISTYPDHGHLLRLFVYIWKIAISRNSTFLCFSSSSSTPSFYPSYYPRLRLVKQDAAKNQPQADEDIKIFRIHH